MTELYVYPRIGLNPGRAAWAGIRIGEILRHAADKEAQVTDLTTALEEQKAGIFRPEFSRSRRELRDMLSSQEDKRDSRVFAAEIMVNAELGLELTDLQSGNLITAGILRAADYRRGTLVVSDDAGDSLELVYAADIPVPEEIEQTYFGRDLTLGFTVTSVPQDKSWVLRD